MSLIWIALGGGIGSVLRYLFTMRVDEMSSSSLPLGIMSVNIVGSFLMGFFTLVLIDQFEASVEIRAAVLFGLIGGFTTFSSFSSHSLSYLLNGEYFLMTLNIVLSVVLCIIAAGVGSFMAKSLFN